MVENYLRKLNPHEKLSVYGILSLVMNTYVCNVKSYSEVSSGGCLITSDKRVQLLFGSWFRTLPKRTESRGKVSEKVHFKLGMDL